MARGTEMVSSLPASSNLDPVEDDIDLTPPGGHVEDELIEEEPTPVPARSAEQERIEALARKKGWRSKEELLAAGGSVPANYRTAEEFLAHGEQDAGILRRELQRMTEQSARNNDTLAEQARRLDEQARELAELKQRLSTADAAGYARAKAEIREEMRLAANNQDVAGVVAATEKLDALEEQELVRRSERTAAPAPVAKPVEEPVPQPKQNQLPAEVVAFMQANPWYMRDARLSKAMEGEHIQLLNEMPALSLSDNLELALARVKDRYPEAFNLPAKTNGAGNQRQRGASPATPTGSQPTVRPVRGIDSIADPSERAEARAAFNSARRADPNLTEAVWFALYQDPHADIVDLQNQDRERRRSRARA